MRDPLFVCFCKCWLYNTHIYFNCSQHAIFTISFLFSTQSEKNNNIRYVWRGIKTTHPKILTRHDRATGSEIPGSSTGLYKNIWFRLNYLQLTTFKGNCCKDVDIQTHIQNYMISKSIGFFLLLWSNLICIKFESCIIKTVWVIESQRKWTNLEGWTDKQTDNVITIRLRDRIFMRSLRYTKVYNSFKFAISIYGLWDSSLLCEL